MCVNAFCFEWFKGVSGNLLGVLVCSPPLPPFRLFVLGPIGLIGVGWVIDGVGGSVLGVRPTELLLWIPWVGGVLLFCTNGMVDVLSRRLEVRGEFFVMLRFPRSGSFLWVLVLLFCGVHGWWGSIRKSVLDDDADGSDCLSGGKSSVRSSLNSGLVSGLWSSFSYSLSDSRFCLSILCFSSNILYGLFTSVHQFCQYHTELWSFLC